MAKRQRVIAEGGRRSKRRRRKKGTRRLPPALQSETSREIVSVINILIKMHAPASWCRLVFLALTSKLNLARDIDHVEYFAGCMSVTQGVASLGRSCVGYEINRDKVFMNILGGLGFLNALLLLLRVRPGGGAFSAPVCSTWVYVNRGTSKRSQARPHGDEEREQVRLANCMVARCCLLMYVSTARGLLHVLEQPIGSLMEKHAQFQIMAQRVQIWKKSVHMSHYGAGTSKPTWLYANDSVVDDIDLSAWKAPLKKTLDMVKVTYSADGKKQISAGADLKASQAYPWGFGRAVASLYTRHSEYLRLKADAMLELGLSASATAWEQPTEDLAELDACIEILESHR